MLHVWIMGWVPDLRDRGGLMSLAEQMLAYPWALLGSGSPVLLQGGLGNVVAITQITGFPPLPGNL